MRNAIQSMFWGVHVSTCITRLDLHHPPFHDHTCTQRSKASTKCNQSHNYVPANRTMSSTRTLPLKSDSDQSPISFSFFSSLFLKCSVACVPTRGTPSLRVRFRFIGPLTGQWSVHATMPNFLQWQKKINCFLLFSRLTRSNLLTISVDGSHFSCNLEYFTWFYSHFFKNSV